MKQKLYVKLKKLRQQKMAEIKITILIIFLIISFCFGCEQMFRIYNNSNKKLLKQKEKTIYR